MSREVLIVDDEDAIRMVVRLGLERVAGWQVREAASADEAVAAVADQIPDLVLLDVMMPGEDGMSALERLRALPGGDQLPVVFLTAKAHPSELDRLHALGVGGIVRKPFDPMVLAAELTSRLGWSADAP